MTQGYVDFEFNLLDALLDRLVEVFAAVEPAPLTLDSARSVPEEKGVYQLFLKGGGETELVYIGKTDAEAGLRNRLSRHAENILDRVGLDPENVLFKAVRIYVFTAMDLETQLIKRFGGTKVVKWNNSGFGSNDTGRERDTTKFKVDHFDALFPIDTKRLLGFEIPMAGSAAEILTSLKRGLPWVFRFESIAPKSRTPHADLRETQVALDARLPITAESVIGQTVRQLPIGWHATALPSHVIMYKDDNRKFPSGRLIARSG